MPVMSGFGALAGLPWERITDKIERRTLAGKQGMIVWWKMKAGAHAASHQHPHEQIVWMLEGRMDFRIGNDRRSMIALMLKLPRVRSTTALPRATRCLVNCGSRQCSPIKRVSSLRSRPATVWAQRFTSIADTISSTIVFNQQRRAATGCRPGSRYWRPFDFARPVKGCNFASRRMADRQRPSRLGRRMAHCIRMT